MDEFVKKLIDRLKEHHNEVRDMYLKGQGNFALLDGKMRGIEDANAIIVHLAKEHNDGWIPFTQREATEDEKELYGEDYEFVLDCKLPDEDEELFVTYANGTVGQDIFLRDGHECYLDSGNEFVTEAIAWQPLPAPYKERDEGTM